MLHGSDAANRPAGWRSTNAEFFHGHGAEADREARRRERDVILPGGTHVDRIPACLHFMKR